MKKYLYIIAVLFLACEDPVDIDLPDAPSAIVVDAWISNQDALQVIRLSETQPYLDSSEPTPYEGAVVQVQDSKGNIFVFNEEDPGEYVWNPAENTERIEDIGTTYALQIERGNTILQAGSTLNRVPPLDSITFTFEEERSPFQPEGYYGEFVATDPEGPGDSYWIKSFKNGQYLNKAFELNIAFDAGFNAGGNIDNVVFIQPIQDAVNPINEDFEIIPYEPGDSLHVEIHAITNEAFYFLQQTQIQIQRDGGFDEIFAEPVENIATNISVVQGNDIQVVGFFSVAGVSSNGRKLEE